MSEWIAGKRRRTMVDLWNVVETVVCHLRRVGDSVGTVASPCRLVAADCESDSLVW